jgi:nucleotide-binding universal stress UspA family protein
MMFRKILVATDFSPPADEAVLRAADLSRRYDAPLTLVYVYQPVAYGGLPEAHVIYTPLVMGDLTAAFEQRLLAAKHVAETAGAKSVQTKLLMGPPAGEITDYARTEQFDLIAIGTHGRTGLSRFLLGSVAEKVVRTAPCPVLSVRLDETRDAREGTGERT